MILKARPCGVEYFERFIESDIRYAVKTVVLVSKMFYKQLINKGVDFKRTNFENTPYKSVKSKSGYHLYLTKEDMEHVYEVKNV